MSRNFDSVRQNDPCTTHLRMSLHDREDGSAQEIMSEAVEALEGNTHVRSIRVIFGSLTHAIDMSPFIPVIENRRQLEEIDWAYTITFPGTMLGDCLLVAVPQNKFIHTLDLTYVRFSSWALALLLLSSRSKLKLSITFCEIVALDAPPELLTSAFQENSSIQDLLLCVDSNEHQFVQQVLAGLGMSSVSRLENLELTMQDPSTRICNAIQELMVSSTMSTLRSLRLKGCSFGRDSFKALSIGIRNSSSATTICFKSCTFDSEATLLFESAFRTTSHNGRLHNLEFEFGFPPKFAKRLSTVLVNVLGSASTLKALKFYDFNNMLTVKEIAPFMHAVACSPSLESLCFEIIDEAEALQAFADGLVQCRWLKKFHFGLRGWVEMDEGAMRRLVRSFQQNTSLEEISYIGRYRRNIFDHHELAKLARYCARNKALPLLMGKPDLIPLQLWPSVWKSVEACHYGPDVIFRSLLALSESM